MARVKPVSTRANPACMKNTRKPATSIHIMFMLSPSSLVLGPSLWADAIPHITRKKIMIPGIAFARLKIVFSIKPSLLSKTSSVFQPVHFPGCIACRIPQHMILQSPCQRVAQTTKILYPTDWKGFSRISGETSADPINLHICIIRVYMISFTYESSPKQKARTMRNIIFLSFKWVRASGSVVLILFMFIKCCVR